MAVSQLSPNSNESTNKTYPLVVSGHVTGPNTFSEIYYLRLNNANPDGEADQLVMGILGKKVKKQTRNYNGTEIREVRLDSARMFTWSVSKGVFIGSFTPYLVEDALRQQKYIKSSSPAVKLMSFVDTNKSHEIYKEWLAMTRPAPGPNGERRPLWFNRAFTPDKSEGGCYYIPKKEQ